MPSHRIAKRAVDIVLALVLLVLTAPALALTALLILVLEGRPVFYLSRRYVGPGRAITMLKFRTMVRDAASPRYRLKERFMRGPYLDIPRNCEVYTRIGHFLERSQTVEVPQVLNVLFSGMSFIGNRPLPFENLQLLKTYDGWANRFGSPAGISGIAQIVGKLNLAPEERLDLECRYSEIYQRGKVLWCDLAILWYTFQVVVLGTNISAKRAGDLLNAMLPRPAVAKDAESEGAIDRERRVRSVLFGATAAFAPGNELMLPAGNGVRPSATEQATASAGRPGHELPLTGGSAANGSPV